MNKDSGTIAGALLECLQKYPWSPLMVLAAMAGGACLGVVAWYQGWLG